MRAISTFTVLVLCISGALAQPQDIAWQSSPDRRNEASVRYLPNGSSTSAKLFVRSTKFHQITETTALDVDSEDDRNEVSLAWSPDGRCLAVSIQVGQLRSFSIYRVASGHLTLLPELPLAQRLQPEHSKSRGGPAFQEWLDRRTFKVFDSSSETEFSYRITAKGKLLATAAKAVNP